MSVDRTLAVTIEPAPDGVRVTDAPPRFYRVFVRDLVVPFLIGIYANEKQAPQRVRVNVDLKVLEAPAPHDDDISNVMSYEVIVDGVKRLAQSGHINLVETLAEQIAELCLGDKRVAEARVCVEKLDIIVEAGSVGVEIERRQSSAGQANVFPLRAPGEV